MKPYVHPSFWSDPDIEQQPPEIKLVALWLITSSHTSRLGVWEASEKRFCFETGLPPEALARTCEALPGTFHCIGKRIFLRNYIRHQFGAGDALMRNNFFKALVTDFLGQSREIQDAIVAEYSEFTEVHKGFARASKPKEGTVGRIGTVGKEEKKPEPPPPKTTPRATPAQSAFETFWQAYPRKSGRLAAERKWHQIKPPLEQCLTAIEHQKQSEQWRKDGGQFIPHPLTWLHQGRWADGPKIELGRKPAASAPPPDPTGWREWLTETYPTADPLTPFHKAHADVQKEFAGRG